MKKILALALALASLSAHAGSITYTNVLSGYADLSSDVAIPQLHPAIGTLSSVVVQVDCIERTTIAAENRSALPQTFLAGLTNYIAYSAGGAGSYNYVSMISSSKAVKAYDGVLDFGGTSGFTSTFTTTNSAQIPLTSIAPFAGASIVPIRVTVTGKSSQTLPGGAAASYISDYVEIRITVTYTYTPALFATYRRNKRLSGIV